MIDTSVNVAGVVWKNPVTTASGTFGSGREFGEWVDLNRLGAVTVKGVADQPWKGNPAPRIAETYGGMLNSVGLQNPGVDYFIQEDIPFLRQFDTKIVVNLCGHTVEEYCAVAEKISEADVDLLELNISCPNVSAGGITFGTDPKMAEYVVQEVKKYTKKPLLVKLTPNVTDITEIARAVESGGADGISLINTLLGMRIDIRRRQPVLANKVGGFSGPAIKPVAVRMVYQVAKVTNLPIVGMGGISTWEDAIEFIMAGATAVAVGTANFTDPLATMRIESYMEKEGISSLDEIRGIIQ